MKLDRPFRIVTHRNWLAKHFADYGAVQDFGFDIDPDTAESTIWWAPGAWVACAYQSGIRLPLTLCGHRWMETLPWMYKQREIGVVKMEDIADHPDIDPAERVHVKLPEAKLDSFPATVFPRRHLASSLRQFHVPGGTLMQLSGVVNFVRECRFWIAHDRITAHSWYLVDGLTSDAEGFTPGTVYDVDRMTEVAMALLSDPNVDRPPGFTLDLGITDTGQILVVEANAAWSSSPYDGDPGGIVKSIVASHDSGGDYPRWHWRPNPVYGTVQPLKWAKPAMSVSPLRQRDRDG